MHPFIPGGKPALRRRGVRHAGAQAAPGHHGCKRQTTSKEQRTPARGRACAGRTSAPPPPARPSPLTAGGRCAAAGEWAVAACSSAPAGGELAIAWMFAWRKWPASMGLPSAGLQRGGARRRSMGRLPCGIDAVFGLFVSLRIPFPLNF
jgi:hypothetical protein